MKRLHLFLYPINKMIEHIEDKKRIRTKELDWTENSLNSVFDGKEKYKGIWLDRVWVNRVYFSVKRKLDKNRNVESVALIPMDNYSWITIGEKEVFTCDDRLCEEALSVISKYENYNAEKINLMDNLYAIRVTRKETK